MYQLANVFAHQFNNADVDSFGMTLPVNVLLMLKPHAFQLFIHGATNSAIVFAKLNQLVSATLNL
jgi:hypothetical protein